MKFFTISLYEFLLYSLNIIHICPSSYPDSYLYDIDNFWNGYFNVDHTRILRELFK